MIFFFLYLFSISVFSRDVSIVWFVKNKDLVNEILNFKKENNLKFDMSIASTFDLNVSTESSFEFCDVFGDYSPLTSVFFPLDFKILKSKVSDSPQLFHLVFDRYYERFISKKCIFFYPDFINKDVLEISKKNNYIWIGGIKIDEEQNVYDYNGTKIVFFEKMISTDTIYKSSSSFFIVDDMDTSTHTLVMLKSLFLDTSLNFVRVSENSDFKNSTLSLSTATFITHLSTFSFRCDLQKNYFYYLSALNSELSKISLRDDIILDYIILLDYFEDVCERENIDEIRDLTSYIYQVSGIEVPSYIYDDFLRRNIFGGYTKFIKDKGVYFVSDTENGIEFSVKESTEGIVFTIANSTQVKEFYIYIDINKLNRVGIEKTLGENFSFYPDFAWEYAFRFLDGKVSLYKIVGRDYKKVKDFQALRKENLIYFIVSKSDIGENFLNWDYILSCYFQDGTKGGVYISSDEKFLKPVK
jgi:hypothetical protein